MPVFPLFAEMNPFELRAETVVLFFFTTTIFLALCRRRPSLEPHGRNQVDCPWTFGGCCVCGIQLRDSTHDNPADKRADENSRYPCPRWGSVQRRFPLLLPAPYRRHKTEGADP